MDTQAQSSEQKETEVSTREVKTRPILETLARLTGGRCLDELAVELARVVNAVVDNENNKPGTVTLTLKLARVKNARKHNAVAVLADVTGKAPEDPPGYDLMFADRDGNLFPHDPDQRDIFDDGPRSV